MNSINNVASKRINHNENPRRKGIFQADHGSQFYKDIR